MPQVLRNKDFFWKMIQKKPEGCVFAAIFMCPSESNCDEFRKLHDYENDWLVEQGELHPGLASVFKCVISIHIKQILLRI